MKTHDWSNSDLILYEAANLAIIAFAEEHPNVEVCCFYFDCDDPEYGLLHISIDSIQHNMKSAKSLEQYAIKRRYRLKGEDMWKEAKHGLVSPVLSPFNTNGGDFEFTCYRSVEFPAWRELAKSKDYPKSAKHEDNYLTSNARLVMWRVVERLLTESCFSPLVLASPFMIGYSMHDEEEAILRIENWPRAQQDAPSNR
jgi:hypothetical protein